MGAAAGGWGADEKTSTAGGTTDPAPPAAPLETKENPLAVRPDCATAAGGVNAGAAAASG